MIKQFSLLGGAKEGAGVSEIKFSGMPALFCRFRFSQVRLKLKLKTAQAGFKPFSSGANYSQNTNKDLHIKQERKIKQMRHTEDKSVKNLTVKLAAAVLVVAIMATAFYMPFTATQAASNLDSAATLGIIPAPRAEL